MSGRKCVALMAAPFNWYNQHQADNSGLCCSVSTECNGKENTLKHTAVTVPLCILGDVQLRFLCPEDLEEVRALCEDWFPIGNDILL